MNCGGSFIQPSDEPELCVSTMMVVAILSTSVAPHSVAPHSAAPHSAARASAQTKNFDVHCSQTHIDARQVAESCEAWRTHLQQKWLGDTDRAAWSPRCVVVVHGRREAYQAAIGRGASRSFGSTLIDGSGDHITHRRIDLLVDAGGVLSALGHELTHVVLADALGRNPPLWAGEGIAILADAAEKQRRHRRDLDQSVHSQTAFHCAELTQLATYPAAHRVPVFYGQSAALVDLLSQCGGPESVVPFLRRAADVGYDQALRETYGIADLAALHRRWLHARTAQAMR
jgi:hypothetical protein